jgi:phosphatidylglycerol lysyltransferase
MEQLLSEFTQQSLLQNLKRYSWLVWLSIGAAALFVLWHRLRDIDLAAVGHLVLQTSPLTLVTATLCCLGVNALAGLYEGIAVHDVTGRRRWLHPAVVASVANPIGHVVGNAVLGSGALRYRLHSAAGLSAAQIGGVIVLTAMPFLLGLGWLLDVTLVLFATEAGRALHIAVPTLIALGAIGLMKDAGWLWFVTARRAPLRFASYTLRVPGLTATLLQTLIGIGEILLSATILYLFLPPLSMSLLTFTAIYLLATMAGQISHVPAGLGVFEASLLIMLPQVAPAQVIGAVLLYRSIYDLLPLGVAFLLLIAHETSWKNDWSRNRG